MFWWKSFWRVFLKSQYRRFPVNFAKYFRKHFCRTPPVDCFCLIPFVKSNTLLFVKSISVTKCYSWPLFFLLIYFKYFPSKYCWSLACSSVWNSKTTSSGLILTRQKCCWKSEAVAQWFSVKMKFCKTSQVS